MTTEPMKQLRDGSPIWHAVAWTAVYIALVNVGDAVSSMLGRDNAVTGPVVLALALVLFLYARGNGWLGDYGIRPVRREDVAGTLLYLPLAIMVSLHYVAGFDTSLDLTAVLLIVALMAGVGFVEELLFRGFLFRAILERSTLTRAIVISGITFGLGHVVNLARGFTVTEQVIQILAAMAIGIVLTLLVAVTGNLMPGVVFHVLFNISANVTAEDPRLEWVVLVAVLVICLGYGVYLTNQLRNLRSGPPTTRRVTSTARHEPDLDASGHRR